MKESKRGALISVVIIAFSVFVNIYIPEENLLQEIFSAVLDGGVASTLILLVTYFVEERKTIYNFYVAADTYTEKMRLFSKYLAEASYILEQNEENTESVLTAVDKYIEKISCELHEEYVIIQKETREFEEHAIKILGRSAIRYYMREFYNATKVDMEFIKMCEEMIYRNELYGKCDSKMHYVYKELFSIFIERDENYAENFVLVRCKILDEILKKFVSKKYISLRKGGEPYRDTEYEVSSDRLIITRISSGRSVRINKKPLQCESFWDIKSI